MIFRQSFNSLFTIYMILQGWCFQKKNNSFLLLLFWHTVSLEYLSRSINELQIKPPGNVSRPKFCHLEQVPPSLAPDDTDFLGFFPHSSGQPFSASCIELPFSTFVEKLTQLSSPLLLYILRGLHFSCLWLQWLIFFVFGWRGLIFIFSSDFPLKSVFQILNASYISIHGCPTEISNSTCQKWMSYLLSKPDGHIIPIFKSPRLKCENHF